MSRTLQELKFVFDQVMGKPAADEDVIMYALSNKFQNETTYQKDFLRQMQ